MIDKSKLRWTDLRVAAYFAIAITLVILPVNVFDGISFCLYSNLFGVQCPTCGMTRAVMHMLHFDVTGASEFNRLVFVVFPLLCGFVLYDVFRIFLRLQKDKS